MFKTIDRAKWTVILTGVAVLVFLALLIVLVWLIGEPGRQKVIAAQATAGREIAKGDAAASNAAVGAVADHADRMADYERTTQENHREIDAQPHATDAVDPDLHDAGLRVLCKRAAYRNTERCVRLRQ